MSSVERYAPGGIARQHPAMPSLGDHVAANVRAERARRRWSQEELGERLGWHRSTVGDLEGGRRRVTADDLIPLCRAFGIPLRELAHGVPEADLRALGL